MPKFLQHCARSNEPTTLEIVLSNGSFSSKVSSTGCNVRAGDNVALIPVQQISNSFSNHLAHVTEMIDRSNNEGLHQRAFSVGKHVWVKKGHTMFGGSGSIQSQIKSYISVKKDEMNIIFKIMPKFLHHNANSYDSLSTVRTLDTAHSKDKEKKQVRSSRGIH